MILKIRHSALYKFFQGINRRFCKQYLTNFILVIVITFSNSTAAYAFFSLSHKDDDAWAFCCLLVTVPFWAPFYMIGEAIDDNFEKYDSSILIVDTETDTVKEIDGLP